jgi:GH15 family glucan-1,4-alpha-glucosidase
MDYVNQLHRHSVETILKNQSQTGAYFASPNFNSYTYSWLRDGSFIAHAMCCAGEYGSARAFLAWVNRTICRYANKVDYIEKSLNQAASLHDSDFLHTRFTEQGDEVTVDKDWGNFQPDGYGTWLWALEEYIKLTDDQALLDEAREGVMLTVRYLSLVWQLPNYDCWEEHPEYIHPYTLGAIYAGLRSASRLAHRFTPALDAVDIEHSAAQVKEFILNFAVVDGLMVKHVLPQMESSLPKGIAEAGVDASLMGLVVPFNLLAVEDPKAVALLKRIETDLHRPGGGVYRYLRDTYFGGGEWVLLSCWLGWCYARQNENEKAEQLLQWAIQQADGNLNLAEQVSQYTLHPEYIKPWQEKWGQVANPLLWSHAMFLILEHELAKITEN